MTQTLAAQDTCVLVTGGAGFIGSHTVVELLERGYRSSSSMISPTPPPRWKIASRPSSAPRRPRTSPSMSPTSTTARPSPVSFDAHRIDRVIHFAGYKAVGESVAKPIEYYSNNVGNTLTLVDVMREHDCKSIIFSSSATVYGDPDSLPMTEESPRSRPPTPTVGPSG